MPQLYQVSLENNYYTFVTKKNYIYRVALNEDSNGFFKGYEDLNENIRVLSIASFADNGEKITGTDIGVRDTICNLLKQLLQNDINLIIFFIIDNDDNRSYLRMNKFISWNKHFESQGNYKLNFTYFNFKQSRDFGSEMGYAGYIINDSNKLKHKVNKWQVEIQHKINMAKD